MFFGGRVRRGRAGAAAGRRRTRRGEDLSTLLTLSFPEAAFGVRRELQLERLVVCDTCLGNGAQPGTAPVACRTCGGTGEIQQVRRSIFGTVMTASPCPTCEGTGQEIPDKCETCFGRGPRARRRDGDGGHPRRRGRRDGAARGRLRQRRRAGGSAGRPVRGHPGRARRWRSSGEGQDLFAVLDVSITQATLGAEVEFETLDGDERSADRAGHGVGHGDRLHGKGVPNLNRRGRGDLYVTVHVVTPSELSREEKKLLEQLAELRGETSKRDPARGELRRPEA